MTRHEYDMNKKCAVPSDVTIVPADKLTKTLSVPLVLLDHAPPLPSPHLGIAPNTYPMLCYAGCVHPAVPLTPDQGQVLRRGADGGLLGQMGRRGALTCSPEITMSGLTEGGERGLVRGGEC